MSATLRQSSSLAITACSPAIALLLLLSTLFFVPPAAHAAQSYDSCTGFIDSIPATISTQGVWCLRKDLSTAISSGGAITIASNNVTIDCNDFKVGGLAGGTATVATGIRTTNTLNTTIRHCNVRGFFFGTELSGAGHVVESNRLEGNTYVGIKVQGDGAIVRDNLIVDTGGSTSGSAGGWATAIDTDGASDIVDNTISGMVNASTRNDVTAIFTRNNNGGTIVRNRVRGLAAESGSSIRIYTGSHRVLVQDNAVQGSSWGLYCDQTTAGVAKDNLMTGGGTRHPNCYDAGGNIVLQ